MSGGNQGVLTLSHTQYQGNDAIANYSVDMNHTDTNGISLSNGDVVGDRGIRTTRFTWYDSAKRVTTMANYGAGDGTGDGLGDAGTLKHSGYTTRPTAEPDWTEPHTHVINGHVLLTKYGYHPQTNRQDTVTGGLRIEGGSVVTNTTKLFHDDAGRVLFTVENWLSDYDPTGADGVDSVTVGENRTVGMSYNGLNQETEKVAYNNAEDDDGQQVTRCFYNDRVNASWMTEKIYPDSIDTVAGGDDQVKYTYNVDGSLRTMTDQRQVVHTYSYNTRRQIILDAATSLGSVDEGVDNNVQAIGRKHDLRSRVSTVTSYAGTTESSEVRNQVQYDYHATHGKLLNIRQTHNGTIAEVPPTEVPPTTSYVYDTSVVDDVYSNGLRLDRTRYPGVAGAEDLNSYSGSNTLFDRLNRPKWTELRDGNLRSGSHRHRLFYTNYTGAGRIIRSYSRAGGNVAAGNIRYNTANVNDYDSFDRFGRKIKDYWLSLIHI